MDDVTGSGIFELREVRKEEVGGGVPLKGSIRFRIKLSWHRLSIKF